MSVGTSSFENRIALVTGAAQGIGLACAAALARGGACVALADINGEQAARQASALGEGASAVRVDVADPASVQAMVAEVVSRYGRIDVFVNSAAVTDDKNFLDSSPADWQRVIQTDLYGTMYGLHEVLPQMVKQRYGRVVCIGTDAARSGQAGLAYYAAAKAGVAALIKSVAQEVGKAGVTLNVVSPGATNTPQRNDREARFRARMGDERYVARVDKIVKRYPLGRLGEVDDVAEAVVFLASDRASWITGQVLSVNGGFSML